MSFLFYSQYLTINISSWWQSFTFEIIFQWSVFLIYSNKEDIWFIDNMLKERKRYVLIQYDTILFASVLVFSHKKRLGSLPLPSGPFQSIYLILFFFVSMCYSFVRKCVICCSLKSMLISLKKHLMCQQINWRISSRFIVVGAILYCSFVWQIVFRIIGWSYSTKCVTWWRNGNILSWFFFSIA